MATATNRPDPSFAVTAIELLQSNSILEAAQLCASGVEHYPDYIGGYILLASAYESLGQMHDAHMIREALHARFPGLPLLKSYVQREPVVYTAEDVPRVVLDEVEGTSSEEYTVVDAFIDIDDDTTTDESVEEEDNSIEDGVSIEVVGSADIVEEVEEDIVFELEQELVAEVFEHVQSYHPNVLRLIEMAPVSTDTRIIRSASVRLIPGLEFTSLRFEGTRSRGRREITSLLDPPAFRTFHQLRRTSRPAEKPEVRKRPATLEELAARLHDARLTKSTTVEHEISKEDFSATQAPIIVTETIARIYMQQGSYELAIEAFKTLQQNKPEKHDEFEKLIKECERKRS